MKWEYRVESRKDLDRMPGSTYADALNSIGVERWELVCVTPDTGVHYETFWFKRPAEDSDERPVRAG